MPVPARSRRGRPTRRARSAGLAEPLERRQDPPGDAAMAGVRRVDAVVQDEALGGAGEPAVLDRVHEDGADRGRAAASARCGCHGSPPAAIRCAQMGPMTTMTASGSARPQAVQDCVGGLAGGDPAKPAVVVAGGDEHDPGPRLDHGRHAGPDGLAGPAGVDEAGARDRARLTTRQPCAELTIAGQPRLPMPAPAHPVVYESPRKAATGRGTVDRGHGQPPRSGIAGGARDGAGLSAGVKGRGGRWPPCIVGLGVTCGADRGVALDRWREGRSLGGERTPFGTAGAAPGLSSLRHPSTDPIVSTPRSADAGEQRRGIREAVVPRAGVRLADGAAPAPVRRAWCPRVLPHAEIASGKGPPTVGGILPRNGPTPSSVTPAGRGRTARRAAGAPPATTKGLGPSPPDTRAAAAPGLRANAGQGRSHGGTVQDGRPGHVPSRHRGAPGDRDPPGRAVPLLAGGRDPGRVHRRRRVLRHLRLPDHGPPAARTRAERPHLPPRLLRPARPPPPAGGRRRPGLHPRGVVRRARAAGPGRRRRWMPPRLPCPSATSASRWRKATTSRR